MSVDELIHKIRLLISHGNITQDKSAFNYPFKMGVNISNEDEASIKRTLDQHTEIQLQNWTAQYHTLLENYSVQSKLMVILLYCLIILISFFGNSIVCKIIFWDSTMRSTINIYIGNLSISDLLMTVLNVPLQLTQILSRNWPLSRFFCRCLPFFQGLSVNVSSFTMACIALDRYQIIAHPLKPRAGMTSTILKIIFIWIMAIIVSSPYPAIADVEEDISYNRIIRCRLIYPKPQYEFRKYLTVITLFVQYLAPLCITGITYFKICSIIWHRKAIGVILEGQRSQRNIDKWKTIKMLIFVFFVFAACWFPLNMYHIYQDFRGPVGYNKHNSTIFLVCHWFAMSSVCCNPFLYCWLNDGFRTIAKSYLRWFLKLISNNNEFHSDISLRKRKISNNTTRLPSKFSTASENLNSRNTSNKSHLASQHFENSDEFNKQYELQHKPLCKNNKLNKSSPLNYIKKKESIINKDIDLEAASPLMDAKETVI